jgi:hypothetical protein
MTKIKSFVFIVIFTISVLGLYAEAPELRNVMPNSWRKVTKLTANEEQAFVRENSAFFAKTKGIIKLDLFGTEKDVSKYKNCSIYKQQVGTDTFYRVLWTENEKPDFLSPNISFWQNLLYKGIVVGEASYFALVATQNGHLGVFYSLDIIPGKEKAKGILKTVVSMRIEWSNNREKVWDIVFRQKGQLFGTVKGWYYLMEEALKKAAGKEHLVIEIYASNCLVDPNIPLRYGLQNAFDGDPSTSYVENTRDDLIEIKLALKDITSKKIAIINGYAQDMPLYKDNNRIKTIRLYYPRSSEFYDIELADNTLGWQFIETDDNDILATEIYRGEKYNDTCIAEHNVYTEQYGWLFGDIDE